MIFASIHNRRKVLTLALAGCIGMPLVIQGARENGDSRAATPVAADHRAATVDAGGKQAHDDASASKKSERDLETRVYSVQDLVIEVPDFPATPQPLPGKTPRETNSLFGSGNVSGGVFRPMMGGMRPGMMGQPNPGASNVPQQDPTTAYGPGVDELVKLIFDTVASDSWKDNGGTVGTMRYLRGCLVITQTPEVQKQISELLTNLRAEQSAAVRIRAHWVLLQPGQLEQIVKAGGSGNAIQEIDPAALRSLAVPHYQAQTVCINGQTVSVSSGREHSVVSSVSAVVGTGVGAFDPTVGLLQNGLTLQVTPMLNVQEKTVMLTIQSTFTAGGGAARQQAHAGAMVAATRPTGVPQNAVGLIDRIDDVMQSLRTTVRVPLGKMVLVGGMTLDPNREPASDKRDGSDKDAGAQLYLIIDTAAGT